MNKKYILCIILLSVTIASAFAVFILKNTNSINTLPHASSLMHDVSSEGTEAVVSVRNPFHTGTEGQMISMGTYSIITFPVYDTCPDKSSFALISYIPEEDSSLTVEKLKLLPEGGSEEIVVKGIMVNVKEMHSLLDDYQEERFYSKMRSDAIDEARLNGSDMYLEQAAESFNPGQMTMLVTSDQEPSPNKIGIILCMSVSLISFILFIFNIFTALRRTGQ